jgi:AcrR family transcriptional regulator
MFEAGVVAGNVRKYLPGVRMQAIVRELIIESAAQLFAEKGCARVSLHDIAALSGVEPAVISELFGSESVLYGTVLETLFSHYAQVAGAAFAGGDKPLAKVGAFAQAFCNLHKQSPYLFTLFYRELLDPSIHFESIVLKNIRHVAYLSDSNFARGIQKDAFRRGVNPAVATMMFVGMFHYYFLAKEQIAGSLLPESVDDEEYIDLALKVFLNGLLKE